MTEEIPQQARVLHGRVFNLVQEYLSANDKTSRAYAETAVLLLSMSYHLGKNSPDMQALNKLDMTWLELMGHEQN